MDSVLQLTPKQRSELFIAAAQQSGIDMVVLEKDFWVCWTLKELFRLPTMGEHLIFKGGTSLSKVFKIINRFSEDIDVSIDRGFLGYGGANEPEAGNSNKEKQRRVEGLMAACQKKSLLNSCRRYAVQSRGKFPVQTTGRCCRTNLTRTNRRCCLLTRHRFRQASPTTSSAVEKFLNPVRRRASGSKKPLLRHYSVRFLAPLTGLFWPCTCTICGGILFHN
jgi:hypothetical protein